ncbi:hypothetical protein EO95_06195 [Methanosarcina sp. 1.H.T.1A.1]|nr:hypothetical protein EO95_06195 [Methanosarcina sp. 1.H.T.1A.1]
MVELENRFSGSEDVFIDWQVGYSPVCREGENQMFYLGYSELYIRLIRGYRNCIKQAIKNNPDGDFKFSANSPGC